MKPILRLAIAAMASLSMLAQAGLASAQPAGVNAGIGTPNDAAWSGSGSGTLVAIDKYIAAKVEATRALLAGTLTVSVSGTPAVTCAACATSANQATEISSLASIVTNTTGASTAANQSTANASLSSIDTKLSSQATAANQTSTNTKLDTLHSDLTAATPAGSNIIGKVGIDQTTPGTTNGIAVAKDSSAAVALAATASSSAEACHVFKASAGNLYGVSGVIGAAGYIMIIDATSAPSDGAVTPTAWAYVPQQGSWSINYGILPLRLSTGVVVCASSTGPFSKTAYSTNTAFSARWQ